MKHLIRFASIALVLSLIHILIIMLPLFMNKVWNSIFVNLTAYKNLMIAKRRIQAVVDEPEEAGSFDALPATGSRIELADVGFAYCKGCLLYTSRCV